MRIEKSVYNDLNLDELAMIIHTFLKRLDIRHQTLSIHIEKVSYDEVDSEDVEKLRSVERYSLSTIASYDKLTSKELINIYEKMQSNTIRGRSDR